MAVVGFLVAFLIAGYRMAGPQRLPLGRPGERPAGFGASAGEPSRTRSRGTHGRPALVTAAVGVGAVPFPRQPLVAGDGAGQAQLGVGGQHQPGPAVGLFGMTRPRGRPTERLLGKPDGVLQVEPANVRAPGQVQIQLYALRAGPPQPQHLRRARLGGDALDLDAQDGAAHDRAWPAAAVAGVALLLGVQPAQQATVTVPYWSSPVTRVAVGAGQVVGSAQLNLAPWRRGRPPLGERATGVGSA